MTLLPIVIILLILSATCAASETAIFALVRLEHTRSRLSTAVQRALERLMAKPLESLLIVIGLNESCNVFAECLATILLLTWLGPAGGWISVPVMFVVVLLFCDITPKTFALGFPGGIARITARPLAALLTIVHPVARWIIPQEGAASPQAISEEEFKALLRVGEFQGQVEPQERELIHKVFDFGNRRVVEVMTPRDKIFSLDIDTPTEQVLSAVVNAHFSRIPVYRNNPNNIVGVLHVKELLKGRLEARVRLARLLRPAYYVPPGKKLNELFDEMRRGRFQLALVVDEYGRILGLITLEDMLEELFGEISDEFDYEGPELTRSGEHEWMVSGAIEVDKLNEALGNGHALDAGGPQTLSSLLLRRLGRVPRPGETFRLGDFEGAVERVRGATVELVRLRR